MSAVENDARCDWTVDILVFLRTLEDSSNHLILIWSDIHEHYLGLLNKNIFN